MNSVLEYLIRADQALFLWLNGHHTPFWDGIMGVVTYKFTWIPLYLFLMYRLVVVYRHKAVGYLVGILAVIILSDQIASGLFKPLFMRLRPCHDPLIGPLVHVWDGCGGLYGFVSSHAATGFGIAAGFHRIPANKMNQAPLLYGWAALYSYSRIYVGVHYPLDILVGGLVGILVVLLVRSMHRWMGGRFPTPYL